MKQAKSAICTSQIINSNAHEFIYLLFIANKTRCKLLSTTKQRKGGELAFSFTVPSLRPMPNTSLHKSFVYECYSFLFCFSSLLLPASRQLSWLRVLYKVLPFLLYTDVWLTVEYTSSWPYVIVASRVLIGWKKSYDKFSEYRDPETFQNKIVWINRIKQIING